MHWLKVEYMPTKAFFKALTSKETEECIKALQTTKGKITNQVDMEEFVNDYKMVFQSHGMT